MKRRSLLATLGLVLVVGGVVLYACYRGDPRQREIHRIQKRLAGLAEALCFSAQDSALRRLTYAQSVAAFFADRTILDVSVGERVLQETMSRREIEQMAARRLAMRGMTVEFVDIAVTLGSNPTHATAHLTATIRISGEQEYSVQEFRFSLVKPEAVWLIEGVTTVKTMEQ